MKKEWVPCAANSDLRSADWQKLLVTGTYSHLALMLRLVQPLAVCAGDSGAFFTPRIRCRYLCDAHERRTFASADAALRALHEFDASIAATFGITDLRFQFGE